MTDFKEKWEESYHRKDNFLFYPHEEIIRFFAQYITKRKGLDEFERKHALAGLPRVLDLGCGIGRHVIFAHEMQAEPYGIDLSHSAIEYAREWARQKGLTQPEDKLVQGDVSRMAFSDNFFDFIISHGVLDSMPFATAKDAVKEASRVLKKGGLFYCDVVSGDDDRHSREYTGEEVVRTSLEEGTIQMYFNFGTVRELVTPWFEIQDAILIRRENVIGTGYISRYHLVLKNRQK